MSGRVAAEFQRRAERADRLAPTSETARSALLFAAGLYRAQARTADELDTVHALKPFTGDIEQDFDRLVAPAQWVLHFAAESGPPALAEQALGRSTEETILAASRLRTCWNSSGQLGDDYLSRSVLRVYAEHLAARKVSPVRAHHKGHCPFCGGPAWIGARRAVESSEGAQRFLGCALCGGEWPVMRIRCPSCGEDNPDKLPQFQTERYPAVRIEACETCRRYVKSIDLTQDARPIPEVDELVSLGMDLWAVEQGYARIEPGLAGV